MAGRRRWGDEWGGQVPPPAVSAPARSGYEGWGPARQAARVPGFTFWDLAGCAGPRSPHGVDFSAHRSRPSPGAVGGPRGARTRCGGRRARRRLSLPSAPFLPVVGGPRGRARGPARSRGERREALRSVLQDRGDHTARGVGGERAEWASEDGRRHRGFLGRRPPPRPLAACGAPGDPRHVSVRGRCHAFLLPPSKSPPREPARCNFLSFVKAASCFRAFIPL